MKDVLIRKVLTYRWVIFGIMAVGYVFVYFHRLCPAVVAVDLQQAFNTTGGFMGLLASAYFYPYAVMQFPAGLLSDSLGPRKTVTCFLVLAGIGSLLFSQASGVEFAVAARVMVGLGVSMVFIPTMKLLSQWFRVREFATMTGILNAMGGLGALTAATPLAITTSWLGWRHAFALIGVGTLLISLLIWLLVRNKPQDLGWPPISEIDQLGPGGSAPPRIIPLWEGAKKVVTEKYFWPVAIWFFFLVGVFFSFGGLWAGPYLTHTYKMSREEAGAILNMIAVGMIIGSPLLSMLSDRVFYSRKAVMSFMSGILVADLLVLYFFPAGLPRAALYMIVFVLSVSSSAIVVIGFTTSKELFPVEIAGTSVGTMNLFPFLGGAVFQPLLGHMLELYQKDATGAYPIEAYKMMFLILVVMSFIAFVSTFFMKETFPGSR
jgi:sugar phosphate permease